MANVDNAKRFSVRLDRWHRKIQNTARDRFQAIALEAVYKLLDKSPVDTGFFRSMWSPLVNEPPVLPLRSRPAGLKSAGGAQPDISRIATLRVGDVIWIVNPTIYGPALENGHSQQAPQGMVGITAQELRAKYGIR